MSFPSPWDYLSWAPQLLQLEHILVLRFSPFSTRSALPFERRIASTTSPWDLEAVACYMTRAKHQIQWYQMVSVKGMKVRPAKFGLPIHFPMLSHIVDLFHRQNLQLTGCHAASEVTSVPVTYITHREEQHQWCTEKVRKNRMRLRLLSRSSIFWQFDRTLINMASYFLTRTSYHGSIWHEDLWLCAHVCKSKPCSLSDIIVDLHILKGLSNGIGYQSPSIKKQWTWAWISLHQQTAISSA